MIALDGLLILVERGLELLRAVRLVPRGERGLRLVERGIRATSFNPRDSRTQKKYPSSFMLRNVDGFIVVLKLIGKQKRPVGDRRADVQSRTYDHFTTNTNG